MVIATRLQPSEVVPALSGVSLARNWAPFFSKQVVTQACQFRDIFPSNLAFQTSNEL
jgi:hypothetical protein